MFADFDGVLTNAAVVLNGVTVATHEGGYLPFSAELTGHVVDGENVLAVIVDARWLNVPPNNPDGGASSVDYLQPGGIYRDVTLRVVPDIHIRDVWAKPVNVLAADRQLQIQVTIDAAAVPSGAFDVTVQLLDGTREIAATAGTAPVQAVGDNVVNLTMTGLGGVTLWSPGTPKLYIVRTTLSPRDGARAHPRRQDRLPRRDVRRRRLLPQRGPAGDLRAELVQLFPYLGMAACARLQRRDARVIRNELQCNMVRCSHYPQSRHFLDACDELGLMVWEEPPGWGYVGDAAFQQVVLQNVRDMVVRDRNRPSVIVWATQRSPADQRRRRPVRPHPAVGGRARRDPADHRRDGQLLAAELGRGCLRLRRLPFGWGRRDPAAAAAGCPVAGQERGGRRAGRRTTVPVDRLWRRAGRAGADARPGAQHRPGRSQLRRPAGLVRGRLRVPQRRDEDLGQPEDARRARHVPGAEARRGVLPVAGLPGGPSGDPAHVLLGFRSRLPRRRAGPGLDHRHQLRPARPLPGRTASGERHPRRHGLREPRSPAGLRRPDGGRDQPARSLPGLLPGFLPGFLPELRIDGWVGGRVVASVRMSADTARDQLSLVADHASLQADGSDTTRLTFRALDAYGNQRPSAGGEVTLSLACLAVLVGDNPFPFGIYGGVGGAFVRSRPGGTGLVTVIAEHPQLGHASVRLTIAPALGRAFL